jgi:hypothetical protein
MTAHRPNLAVFAAVLCLICSCNRGGDRSGSPAPVRDASPDVCGFDSLPATPICCGRPGEVVGNNCFDKAAIEENLNHCIHEGVGFDGRRMQLGVLCCPGLTTLSAYETTDASVGDPGLPAGCLIGGLGIKVCGRCGDGVCGPAENYCNCPADCHP